MSLIDIINDIHLKLSVIDGVKTDISLSEHCNSSEINELEKKFEIQFSKQLKDIYLNHASTIQFSWNVDDNRFGLNCKRGFVNLLSPKDIISKYDDMISMVGEGVANPDELAENEGLKALVEDWPNWIPIFSFPNGDYFCIDKHEDGNPIIFLEHDVMDGGPNVHGLKIALNFDDLVYKWSKVGFVDIYDWTDGTNSDGIDFNLEVFKELLKVL